MLKGQKKSTPYRHVKLRCRHCSKIVQRYRCLIKTFKYCSAKCKQLSSRGKEPKSKIKYVDLIPCICENADCKKIVKLVPYKAKSFKFCSRYCMHKTIAINRLIDSATLLLDINSPDFVGSSGNQSYVYEKDFVNEKEKVK